MKKALFIFSVLTLGMNCLFAQGIWKSYTVEDGLANNYVWCVDQDKDGNMWFGTKKGISKLDTNGIFTGYLTDCEIDWVMDIEFDSLEHIWMTVGAVYERPGNYVIEFCDTFFKIHRPAEGILPIQEPVCVGKDSDGSIWVGMQDNYAWRFDGKQWEAYYVWGTRIYDVVNDIVTDRNGKLFFVHDAGITTLEDGSLWLGVDTWLEMLHAAFDQQNRMWCTSRGNGLRMLQFDPYQWTFYNEEDGLLSNSCETVAVDSNNLVWIGFPYGAQRFDGKNWLTFTDENGLIHNLVWDIFVDKEGDIWFGTKGGVSVFHDTTSTTHVKPSQLSNLPVDFKFYPNFPNPFNSATQFCYSLEKSQIVRLVIYNANGQLIKELVNTFQLTGIHEIVWNARDTSGKEVSSGVYFGVLQVGINKTSQKMLLIR